MDENNWTYENFYFGNGGWPSDATWRSSGNRYQCMVELDDATSFEDASVLWTYFSDNEKFLEPSYYENKEAPKIASLVAWVEGSRDDYLFDRKAGWLKPDGTYGDPRERWQWFPLEKGPTLF